MTLHVTVNWLPLRHKFYLKVKNFTNQLRFVLDKNQTMSLFNSLSNIFCADLNFSEKEEIDDEDVNVDVTMRDASHAEDT